MWSGCQKVWSLNIKSTERAEGTFAYLEVVENINMFFLIRSNVVENLFNRLFKFYSQKMDIQTYIIIRITKRINAFHVTALENIRPEASARRMWLSFFYIAYNQNISCSIHAYHSTHLYHKHHHYILAYHSVYLFCSYVHLKHQLMLTKIYEFAFYSIFPTILFHCWILYNLLFTNESYILDSNSFLPYTIRVVWKCNFSHASSFPEGFLFQSLQKVKWFKYLISSKLASLFLVRHRDGWTFWLPHNHIFALCNLLINYI